MLIAATLIVAGMLCAIAGYAVGKAVGHAEEFREAQRATELMEFTIDAAKSEER